MPSKKKPTQRGTKESQEATVERAKAGFDDGSLAPPKAAPPVVTQQTCPRCHMRFRTVTR
jgi:hypothetical protein